MEPHVSFISLGVRDVGASRRFYVDALGWPVRREVPGEIVFIQVNHGLMLGLWSRAQMDAETGTPATEGTAALTLSQNVGSEAAVDTVLETVRRAGAAVVAAPARQAWGGYSAYFTDPDGFRWEVAYNPGWSVDGAGTVTV